jgi:hypothetical protein
MTTRHSSSRPGSTRLAVIAALAVIAGGAYLLYGYFGSSPIKPDSGKAIAEPFLEKIRSGKPDTAWETTTAEFKSNLGRENFLKYVDDHPLLKEPLEFYSLQTVSLNDVPMTECVFGKQGSPGSGPKVRVILAKEQGNLKVERLIAEEPKK